MLNPFLPYILNYLSNNREATLEEIGDSIRSHKDLTDIDNYTIQNELQNHHKFFKLLPSGRWTLTKWYSRVNKIQDTIVQILKENGGRVEIRDRATGWNIYDEVANRVGVSHEDRRRLTQGTEKSSENAWRVEVGYARKNLVEIHNEIAPTSVSGRGVWMLVEKGLEQ